MKQSTDAGVCHQTFHGTVWAVESLQLSCSTALKIISEIFVNLALSFIFNRLLSKPFGSIFTNLFWSGKYKFCCDQCIAWNLKGKFIYYQFCRPCWIKTIYSKVFVFKFSRVIQLLRFLRSLLQDSWCMRYKLMEYMRTLPVLKFQICKLKGLLLLYSPHCRHLLPERLIFQTLNFRGKGDLQ